MKISVRQLKYLIHEALYKARTPDGRETYVDAVNTKEAGDDAARHFGGGIDPFTIDIQPISDDVDKSNGYVMVLSESAHGTYYIQIETPDGELVEDVSKGIWLDGKQWTDVIDWVKEKLNTYDITSAAVYVPHGDWKPAWKGTVPGLVSKQLGKYM